MEGSSFLNGYRVWLQVYYLHIEQLDKSSLVRRPWSPPFLRHCRGTTYGWDTTYGGGGGTVYRWTVDLMRATYCYNIVENGDSWLPRIVEYDLQQSLCGGYE